MLINTSNKTNGKHFRYTMQLLVFMAAVRERLLGFNTFDSGSNDPRTKRIERCTSWIYVLVFISVVGILSFYTSFETQTTTVRVKRPSLSTYRYLESMYSDTLQCPCSTTDMQYSMFVKVYPRFHQVCCIFNFVTFSELMIPMHRDIVTMHFCISDS